MQKAKLGLVRKKSRLGSARNRKGGCYQSVSEAVVMFTSCVHFTNFFAFVFFFQERSTLHPEEQIKRVA